MSTCFILLLFIKNQQTIGINNNHVKTCGIALIQIKSSDIFNYMSSYIFMIPSTKICESQSHFKMSLTFDLKF